MYTLGPETRRLTSSCPRPQKLHRIGCGEWTRFFMGWVSGAWSPYGDRLGPFLLEIDFGDHLVHDSICLGFFRGHEEVPIGVLLDLGQRLFGVPRQDLVQLGPEGQDLLGVDLDVGRLPLAPSERLMDHDPRVRERRALAMRARGEKQRRNAGRLSHADRRHVRLDELHGVVDGQARRDYAARRIDVEVHVAVRVLGFEKQELRNDQVRDDVVDRRPDEDDPIFEKAGKDVIGPFPAPALLDHNGYQPHFRFLPVAAPLLQAMLPACTFTIGKNPRLLKALQSASSDAPARAGGPAPSARRCATGPARAVLRGAGAARSPRRSARPRPPRAAPAPLPRRRPGPLRRAPARPGAGPASAAAPRAAGTRPESAPTPLPKAPFPRGLDAGGALPDTRLPSIPAARAGSWRRAGRSAPRPAPAGARGEPPPPY